MLNLAIGKKFLNGRKEVITIIGTVEPDAVDYSLGHRFVDQNGTGYTENGQFNKNNPAHAFNLVGELPDTLSATSAVIEQPGFFEHLGNKMSDNPLKTMFGLTVAAGLGYLAYDNYTSSRDNDVGETVEVAAAFMSSWK